MNNYGENMCKAISIITQKEIKNLSFDKTISCWIVNIIDDNSREYLVTDGVSEFIAYGDSDNYSIGDTVYVLIPQGDYSLEKRILFKKHEKSEQGLKQLKSFDSILFGKIQEYDKTYGLSVNSNPLGSKITIKSLNTEIFELNSSYTKLGIEAAFQTSFIQSEQMVSGTYGIKIFVFGLDAEGKDIKEIYNFKTDDFFGDPYQFSSKIFQSTVFDISKFKQIKDFQIIFFENGDFYMDNLKYYEKIKQNNIFVSDIKIVFGNDINEYSNNDIILNSQSSINYSRENQSSKKITAKIIRKNSDNILSNIEAISSKDILGFNGELLNDKYRYLKDLLDRKLISIYWYKYSGTPIEDVILQEEGWEIIAYYNNKHGYSNEAAKDLEKEKNFLELSFIPNLNNLNEKIKLAFVFNGYLQETNNGEIKIYDPLKEIDLKEIKKNFLNSSEDNYTQILNDKDNILFKNDDIELKYNILLSDPIILKSEDFVFINSKNLNDIEANLIQNLIIECLDDYQGKYFIYDLRTKRIQSSLSNERRELKIHYTELQSILNPSEKISITWKISTSNSMIMPFGEGWEIIDDYYVKKDSQIVQYKIKEQYLSSCTNNNVICIIKKGDTEIFVEKELEFGISGSNETQYTLSLNLGQIYKIKNNDLTLIQYDNQNFLTPFLDENYWIEIKPSLYDNFNNKLISIDESFELKWDWRVSSTEFLEYKKINQRYFIRLLSNLQLEDYKRYCAISKLSLTYNDIELVSYLPIPIVLNKNIIGYTGPDSIVYDMNEVKSKKIPQLIFSNLNETQVEWQTGLVNIEKYCGINSNPSIKIDPVSKETISYYKDLYPYFQENSSGGNQLIYSNFYYKDIIELSENTQIPISIFAMKKNDKNQEELLYVQPLLIIQNFYGNSYSNSWNGEFFEKIGEEILTNSILGSGIKTEDNKFSGVLIGQIQNNKKIFENGLYGYKDNNLSFAFRDNGTAFIGSGMEGRIEFDGNKGIIKSGNYKESNDIKQGVKIDLSEGKIFTNFIEITGGTLKLYNEDNKVTFRVREDGHLYASNAFFRASAAEDDSTSGTEKEDPLVVRIYNGKIILKGRWIDDSINSNGKNKTGIYLTGGFGYYSLARLSTGNWITDKKENGPIVAWDLGIDGRGASENKNALYRFIISLSGDYENSNGEEIKDSPLTQFMFIQDSDTGKNNELRSSFVCTKGASSNYENGIKFTGTLKSCIGDASNPWDKSYFNDIYLRNSWNLSDSNSISGVSIYCSDGNYRKIISTSSNSDNIIYFGSSTASSYKPKTIIRGNEINLRGEKINIQNTNGDIIISDLSNVISNLERRIEALEG